MMNVTASRVEAVLQRVFQPTSLDVQDDSAAHAGHAGAQEGRHFSVSITSQAFHGKGRVARHRLVYDALAPLIAEGIHALAIVARAPDDVT